MFILLLVIAIATLALVATIRGLAADGYHREPVRAAELPSLRR